MSHSDFVEFRAASFHRDLVSGDDAERLTMSQCVYASILVSVCLYIDHSQGTATGLMKKRTPPPPNAEGPG